MIAFTLVTVTNGTDEAAASRKVIHVSCSTHGGPAGFANLVMRKRDGTIELDPHATGACVIELDEHAATTVRDTITEWLG